MYTLFIAYLTVSTIAYISFSTIIIEAYESRFFSLAHTWTGSAEGRHGFLAGTDSGCHDMFCSQLAARGRGMHATRIRVYCCSIQHWFVKILGL